MGVVRISYNLKISKYIIGTFLSHWTQKLNISLLFHVFLTTQVLMEQRRMLVEVERSWCPAKGFFPYFWGVAAQGPSALPSPPGTWDLQVGIRFLEVPGQHPCPHSLVWVGAKLIITIFVIFAEHLQLFCAAIPGLWAVQDGVSWGELNILHVGCWWRLGEWNCCCDLEPLDAGRRDLLSKTSRGDGFCVC